MEVTHWKEETKKTWLTSVGNEQTRARGKKKKKLQLSSQLTALVFYLNWYSEAFFHHNIL